MLTNIYVIQTFLPPQLFSLNTKKNCLFSFSSSSSLIIVASLNLLIFFSVQVQALAQIYEQD